jgi:hypothetical protein
MSRFGRLVTVILLGAALIVGYTMLQPVILAYQVKTAARISCNQMIREVRTGQLGTKDSGWEKFFMSRAGAETGIKLKREDFEFDVDGKENPRGDLYCNAKIRVPTVTPWIGISEVMDLPPYRTTKIVKLERHKVPAGF